MLRLYGKRDVAVLNGNWPCWLELGASTESGPAPPPAVVDDADVFVPEFQAELVRDMAQMVAHAGAHDAVIIDARGKARFIGAAAEPRPGLLDGHIPGSLSLPYREIVDDAGRLLPLDDLRAYFAKKGVPLGGDADGKPVVATCGSGVTACTLALGLFVADGQEVAVYDGSWTEYGKHTDNPVETGEGGKD